MPLTSDPVHYALDEHTFDNGLRLIVNHDPTAPGVAVNLWYQVGSRDEVVGRTGFAHLFEHLMFQGTWTGVATGEHLAAIQSAGGTANATTSFDRTNYFETVHPGALELALWLEAQRMEHLMVDQTNLDTQREVVKEEKRQRYDNVPYGETIAALFELAYPADHPYGHTPIGSMDDLDAAALEDVQAFHQLHYSPGNAILVLAGAVGLAEAVDKVGAQFGAIPATPVPQRSTPAGLPAFAGNPTTQLVRDVPRDATHLVWHIPRFDHPDALAIDLALDVLGSGQSARWHRDLVVRRDLAEGVSGSTMGLVGDANLALVSSRTRDGVSTDELVDAILDHITRLADKGPSAEEMQRVHAQLERSLLTELASLEARADEINQWASLTGDPARINHILTDYAAITPAAIQQAVRTWLAPEARATLTFRKADA
ncbi:M16 family metallopeptidase [Propionibacteriaceae bacterium G57]|uniref:M16 family metallopeptidase n=1 Tax=Aestuariimicrobium sp. G57 TaxID=3418485 RepID=UPI003DA7804D